MRGPFADKSDGGFVWYKSNVDRYYAYTQTSGKGSPSGGGSGNGKNIKILLFLVVLVLLATRNILAVFLLVCCLVLFYMMIRFIVNLVQKRKAIQSKAETECEQTDAAPCADKHDATQS